MTSPMSRTAIPTTGTSTATTRHPSPIATPGTADRSDEPGAPTCHVAPPPPGGDLDGRTGGSALGRGVGGDDRSLGEPVVQLGGVARDGDDEDEVEEQLERGGDPARLVGVARAYRPPERGGDDAHGPEYAAHGDAAPGGPSGRTGCAGYPRVAHW